MKRKLFPLVLILLTLTFSSCGTDGKDGESCTVVENEDGSVTIECPDWTKVVVENGENGEDGADGVDGTNGIDGEDGTSGINGEDGADGTNGTDGIDGADGTDGLNGTDGADGEDAQDCPVPESTFQMIHTWSEADAYRNSCDVKAEVDMDKCLNSGEEGCFEKNNLDHSYCHYWFGKRINMVPFRTCGIKLFIAYGEPDDEDYTYRYNDGDEDADGISTYWELKMGYNPCEAESFGCNYQDSEMDYDKDGIPNGEDESPICNPNDEWASDCL